MSIYYGSLSSDSVDLFKNQIRPILVKFQKYVNFDFVPFGNADVSVLDFLIHILFIPITFWDNFVAIIILHYYLLFLYYICN